MSSMIRVASVALVLGLAACGGPLLNVKFVEPNISHFKSKGNRVVVGEGSLVSDVLAIEVMKNGKFVIAGHELPKEEKAKAALLPGRDSSRVASASMRSNAFGAPDSVPAAAPVAVPAAAPEAAPPAPAAPEAASPSGDFDYVFSVNTSSRLYAPQSNDYPATYSFSVTAASGEIIYIKALSGGDLKGELASTLGEVAGLLL